LWFSPNEHEARAEPLASLQHHVVGVRLRVAPGELFVPKGIPGSLSVDLVTGDGSRPIDVEAMAKDKYIEAVLRGPAFPAYRLLGLPNEPLMLPPIALAGEYQIDDIRLVDATNENATPMMGSPSRVTVHVFPEVLISQVTSRPLSLDEIQARGIRLDARNFSVVEFTAMFAIGGRTVPFRLPVVAPKHKPSTEIIPIEEMEARLVTAKRINEQLSLSFPPPIELNLPGLNIHVAGVNFQAVRGDGEMEVDAPSIPGLLVIPGNIGFLNQFFSVQVFTANASPSGSNMTVHTLTANIALPPGGENAPLRLADTGAPDPEVVILAAPGADGQLATSDDQGRLQPGQGEFLVEGMKTGLHLFDIELNGILDGLAAGEVRIRGRVSGSVLVGNPKFSLTFAHPETVQRGDAYEAALTVLNTSDTDVHLVTVNLHANQISGAHLIDRNAYSVALGTIKSGESKTAVFELEADLTGSVLFNNLTGDDDLTGSFELTLGVDENGLILSDRTIGYPNWVYVLPRNLRRAADRVLGQALAISTARYLPPGIRRIEPQTVERRVTELAEAGQRIKYGDDPVAVYRDLLLDWQGGRDPSLGFDQILRETNAGEGWRQALIEAIEDEEETIFDLSLVSGGSNVESIAGRHEGWGFAATNLQSIVPSIRIGGVETGGELADVTESASYVATTGSIVAVRAPAQRLSRVQATFRVPAGQSGEIAWVQDDGDGGAFSLKYSVTANASVACYHYFPADRPSDLILDLDCQDRSSTSVDGILDDTFQETAPEILAAKQELDVLVARPFPFCGGPTFQRGYGLRPNVEVPYQNYGTLVAVLFSKQMDAASIERSGAFLVNGELATNGVRIQPGGRVALVNLRRGMGAIGPLPLPTYELVASGVTDRAGTALSDAGASAQINLVAERGVAIQGRVFGTDGAPVANIPVTLIMHDEVFVPPSCGRSDTRLSQMNSDTEGRFDFGFVMSDLRLGYSVAATDTRNLNPDAVALLNEASPNGELDPGEIRRLALQPGAVAAFMETFGEGTVENAIAKAEGVDRAVFHDTIPQARVGSTVPVALRFRGRGRVSGTVYASDEVTPVAGVAVNLFPDLSSRELGRGVISSANGRFQFDGVPLGPFTIHARSSDGPERIVAENLTTPGGGVELDVVLSEGELPKGSIAGYVLEADETTVSPGAIVGLRRTSGPLSALVVADGEGYFHAQNIATGTYAVLAISADRRRTGNRLSVLIQEDLQTNLNLHLGGTSRVHGRVVFANGQPAVGAQVSGGAELTTTIADGLFTVDGVPTGVRSLSAGLSKNPAAGRFVTRLGSSELDVVPGDSNFVEIRLRAAANLSGTVVDANDQVVTDTINVAIPQPGGFYWAPLINGQYEFLDLSLGSYLVSAPAPPVEDQLPGVPPNASEEELLAIVGEAFQTYANGSLGPAQTDTAGGYGYSRVDLDTDNQTETQNITYIPQATLSGNVTNENSVPIIAQVIARGLKRAENGGPTFGLVGMHDSHPGTGAFQFPGINTGFWTLTAASPFYSMEASASGLIDGEDIEQDLQFASEGNRGRIRGLVLLDGVPAGDVKVSIPTHHSTYSIYTDSTGHFLTTEVRSLPHRVFVEDVGRDPPAEREPTERVAFAQVQVRDGVTTEVIIPLLAATGALTVEVFQANGQTATNRKVVLKRTGSLPEVNLDTNPDTTAVPAVFAGLIEGTYLVTACDTVNTALCGSRIVEVSASPGQSTTVTLQASGTISGTYYASDGTTPIDSAQVAVGDVAYAVTDASGEFSAAGIPIGRHVVVAHNAVTGRAATAIANILYADHELILNLVEDDLGEVFGTVIGSDQVSPVPAATVELQPTNRLFQETTVSTGPTGQFSFPGVPPGEFTLHAQASNSQLSGNATGVMPESAGAVQTDVVFAPRGSLRVRVLNPDGSAAHDATVSIPSGVVGTDNEAWAELVNLPLGRLQVTANAPAPSRSAARATVMIEQAGAAPDLTLTLGRLGTVVVTVLDESTPVTDATVTVRGFHPIIGEFHDTIVSDVFTFDNIPLGEVEVVASDDLQGGSAAGALTAQGDLHLTVNLAPARTVVGRLVRPTSEAPSPVHFAQVNMDFTPVNGGLGGAQAVTEGDGTFTFVGIPVGSFTLRAELTDIDAVLYRDDFEIPANAPEEYDLEDVYLDMEEPSVETTFPPHGAVGVPTNTVLEVNFTEAMDESIENEDVVYITDGTNRVPVTLQWYDADTLHVLPDELAPGVPGLLSTTTYSLVVRAGPSLDAFGAVSDPGLRDLARRDLFGHTTATFTTLDERPPEITSFTPVHDQPQVSENGVIRIVFDEAMDVNEIDICVHEEDSPTPCVDGTLSLTLRDLVAVYDPVITNNKTYTVTLIEAKDRGGNSCVGIGTPFATRIFHTLDTVGPTIDHIDYNSTALVEGATAIFTAVLVGEEEEEGYQIRAGFRVPSAQPFWSEVNSEDVSVLLPGPSTGLLLDFYAGQSHLILRKTVQNLHEIIIVPSCTKSSNFDAHLPAGCLLEEVECGMA
jgi:hypothetical protein